MSPRNLPPVGFAFLSQGRRFTSYQVLLEDPSQVGWFATRWMEEPLTPDRASPAATLGSAIQLNEPLLRAVPRDKEVVTGARPRICGATHMLTEASQVTRFVERRISWLVVRAPSRPCRHLTGEASPRRVVLFIPGSTSRARIDHRAWVSADDLTRSAWIFPNAPIPR